MLRTALVCKLIDLFMDMVVNRLMCVVRPRSGIVLKVGMQFTHLIQASSNNVWQYSYKDVRIRAIDDYMVHVSYSHVKICHYFTSPEQALAFLQSTNLINVYAVGCAVIWHQYNKSTIIDIDEFLQMVAND